MYPQQGAGSSERIVIQDMAPGVYDIEVQSLSPFEKTLKGTFVIPEKENDIFCVKEDQQGSFCVQLIVSVKDYGTGIPKESLGKIWDRFYKIDASRGKDRKGTGLGLSIVKEIINAHNQNIDVISTEGVGTEFIFTLEKTK